MCMHKTSYRYTVFAYRTNNLTSKSHLLVNNVYYLEVKQNLKWFKVWFSLTMIFIEFHLTYEKKSILIPVYHYEHPKVWFRLDVYFNMYHRNLNNSCGSHTKIDLMCIICLNCTNRKGNVNWEDPDNFIFFSFWFGTAFLILLYIHVVPPYRHVVPQNCYDTSTCMLHCSYLLSWISVYLNYRIITNLIFCNFLMYKNTIFSL